MRKLQKLQALEEMLAEARAEKDRLVKAIDILPDAEWEEAYTRIYGEWETKSDAILDNIHSLEYPQSRNAWFADFVKSFGTCKDKRISYKQASIFVKYGRMQNYHSTGRGISYYVTVNSLFCKCTIFSEHEPGYITIKKLINVLA